MTDHSEEKLASQFGISVAKVQAIKRMRGLTDDVMVGMSPEVVQRLDRRLQLGDLPHARTSFRRLQERDDSGQLAYQARTEAVARKEELMATAPAIAATQSLGPWKQLGPGNIGGRTRSIVIHPTSTGTIWAGSVGGGIWRSTNSGSSWAPVNDRMGNLAVCCMIMDPTNPNIIYAGTGEGFYNLDAIRGAGIFRTTDGTNWSVLPPTAASDNFRYVNRIAISKDGKTVLAATSTGLFRSTDPASSWPQVMSGFPFADVKFHPTNP
ncbi:MAG: hypothetical protein K2Q10_08115, partial [Rhodospirillales bacterium]|nr:hypothetical protein [Rhodospirillales bacterium]